MSVCVPDLDYYFNLIGVHPNITLECSDPSAIRSLIDSELGISFYPEYSWGTFPSKDNIVRIPIVQPVCTRYLYLAWGGTNREKTAIVTVFETFLRDFFEKLKQE